MTVAQTSCVSNAAVFVLWTLVNFCHHPVCVLGSRSYVWSPFQRFYFFSWWLNISLFKEKTSLLSFFPLSHFSHKFNTDFCQNAICFILKSDTFLLRLLRLKTEFRKLWNYLHQGPNMVKLLYDFLVLQTQFHVHFLCCI